MGTVLPTGVPASKVGDSFGWNPPPEEKVLLPIIHAYRAEFPYQLASGEVGKPPVQCAYEQTRCEVRIANGSWKSYYDVSVRYRSTDDRVRRGPARLVCVGLEIKSRIRSAGQAQRQFRELCAMNEESAYKENKDMGWRYITPQTFLIVLAGDPLVQDLANRFAADEWFYAWDGTRLLEVPGNMDTYTEPAKLRPVRNIALGPLWGGEAGSHSIH